MKENIYIDTLGCARNESDSGYIKGLLKNKGYTITEDINNTQIVIVNTCSFIRAAKEESIDTILNHIELKNKNIIKRIYVIGCLPQYYKYDLLKELPEIDGVMGTAELDKITDFLEGKYKPDFKKKGFLNKDSSVIRDVGVFHYIKISEGCSKKCGFCKIPDLKGKYKTRPKKNIIKEAQSAVSQGIREIVLIGQETTNYGFDKYKDYNFKKLLKDLSKMKGDFRIRFLYCYFADIDIELIDIIKNTEKIYPYFDIPFQHSDKKMLRYMKRQGTEKIFLNLIDKIRNKLDESYIRSSFIIGHPGEGKKEFNNLKKFLKDAQLDRAVFFPYSIEEGTMSSKYKDAVKDDIISLRYDSIRKLQFEIEYNRQQKLINKTIEVLIEEMDNKYYYGRTYRDAPEIDGRVILDRKKYIETTPGDFINAKITGTDGINLYC